MALLRTVVYLACSALSMAAAPRLYAQAPVQSISDPASTPAAGPSSTVAAAPRPGAHPFSRGAMRQRAAHRFLAERGLTTNRSVPPAELLRRARSQRSALTPQPDSSTPTWIAAGPAQVTTSAYGAVTGRITSVAADPSDTSGNTVFFGSTGGGVWKSTNAKTGSPPTFQPLTDTLSAFTQNGGTLASLSIGALTVQPGGTGVVLAGTGDINDALDSYYGVGILRSTDGGNTWSLVPGSSDGLSGGTNYEFTGEGFAGFAWSTTSTQLVVAAVAQSAESALVNAGSSQFTIAGLYYSPDAGSTWHLATIEDQDGQTLQSATKTFQPPGNSVTAVVWNPIRQRFYAAVRFHGYYDSPDGMTWTRLLNQPGANLSTSACPTNPGATGSTACPIFRGALAVQPLTGDLFALTTDINNGDQGLFQDQCSSSGLQVSRCSSSTVVFGTELDSTPFEVGNGNTTIAQADYNLALAAIPQQQDTLVFVGTEDIFRCSLANSCAWRNTTNVENCAAAAVAPSEHAFEATFGSTGLLYFGNDGGLWRTTDAAGETDSVCASTDSSHFQNLNGGIGSLAEISDFAVDPTDSAILLASIGGFGTVASESSASQSSGSTAPWQQVLTGEGGFVAIDPVTPQNWYADAGAGVTIHQCTSGSSCTAAGFGASPAVGRTQVEGDADFDSTAAPWILDPFNTGNVLVGTCRVWRGPANGSGWSSSNLLSPMLDGNQQAVCTSNAILRSLAASGNLPAATGDERIYAGMYGYAFNGSTVPGHLYGATVSQSSGLFTWTDLWLSPVTNNSSSNGQFNPGGFSIPSIAVDPHDSSGQTLYVAIQGFPGNGINSQLVYRSGDGGAHWLDVSGGLPIAPVNSIVVDPNSASTVYLATDAGVYVTQTMSSCSSQNCWAVYGTGLPNAPVTGLELYNNGASSVLMASTYGRGIWKIGLLTAPQSATATFTPSSLTFAAQPVGTASAGESTTLNNTGAIALTIGSIRTSGDYSETNNCPASLATGASCTIEVVFTPTATGDRPGLLTLSGNVAGGLLTANLDGSGQAAGSLALRPTSLTFATTLIGSSTNPKTITASNTGGTSIQLGTATLTAGYIFGNNGCTNLMLAPSGSCTLQVAFAPSQSGDQPGTLSVPSNLPSPSTVALDGTGIAPAALSLTPSPVAFPSTPVGATSAAQMVMVTSSGGVTVQVGTPSVTGNYAIAANSCGTTLAPGATCTLQITFSPAATGSRAGLLTVPASNISGKKVTDALSGTGATPPVLTLSPSPASFPSTMVGDASTPVTITVAASGGVAAQLGTPSVSGDYALGPTTCGATLFPNSTCTIAVTFDPSAQGTRSGTLTVPAPNASGGSVTDSLTGTGLAPAALTLTPSSLTFAAAAVGTTSAAQSITVTSSGGVSVQLGTPAVSGDYAVAGTTCGSTLAAMATCTVQITFSPTATGDRPGLLTVPASNIAGGKVTAALDGTGLAPGNLSLSPTSSNLGSVVVGTTSASVTIMATNSGGVPVALQGASITGDFAIASSSCSASVPANSSCAFQVTFTPTTTGSRTGMLSVPGAFSGSPATAALTGTGLQPGNIVLAPATSSFGPVVVGATSNSATITATNSGGGAVALQAAAATGDFTVGSTTCGASLAAGSNCSFQLTFTPTATGSRTGTLSVPGAFTGSPATASLTGTGLAPGSASLAPPSNNFGQVLVGQTSLQVTITATNSGGAAVSLQPPSVSGDYAIVSTTCGASLASQGNCAVQVTFTPTAAGTRTGLLSLGGSFSGSPATASLTGTGLAPAALSLAPSPVSFPSTAVGGSSAAQAVTVMNTGGVAAQLGPPSVTSGFSISGSTCGASLAADASCTLQLIFQPTSSGSASGTLTVPASNITGGQATDALAGTGVPPAALSISPASYTFAPLVIGAVSSPQTFTVTNTGGVAAQTGAASVTGDYAVAANTCGSALSPLATCSIQVTFSPSMAGDRPGVLTILAQNIAGGKATAALDGTGLAPAALAVSPLSLSFGSVVEGSASAAQSVSVTNTGGVAAQLGAAAVSSTDYQLSSDTCGATLAPSAACILQVVFHPAGTGDRPATLKVPSSTPGSPATVALDGNGLAPGALVLTPGSLVFSAAVVGMPSTSKSVTITNSGGAAVQLGTITTSLADYQISSNNCGSSIAAGANCSVGIIFKPAQSGSRAGLLNVPGNVAGGSVSATLAGTGLAPANLTIAPASSNLGAVAVGSTSMAVTFTASNDGDVADTLQAPTITGDFAIASTTCSPTLAAGGHCSVQVTFTPSTTGGRSGTLSIGGSFTGSPATASLSGTGLVPGNVMLAPATADFGTVVIGKSSAPASFTASNSGEVAVPLQAPAATGDYTVSSTTCTASLAPNGTCSIQVTFAPQSAGSRTGSLSLAGTFAGSPATASLSGMGVTPGTLALTPSSYNFGSVALGSTSTSATITARNTGGAPVSLQTPSASGDFAVASTTCTPALAAGASCTLFVTFSPTALGSRSGVLSIGGTFSSSPATAALTGQGVTPGNLTLSPAAHNFGAVVVGTTKSAAAFTANNSGGTAVSLQAPATSGDFAVLSTSCGASLPAGGSCVVQVTFTPSATGLRTGALSIAGSFATSPASSSLSGTGVSPGNLALSPAGDNFGIVVLGTTSASATFVAANNGGAPVTLGTPSASGDFAIASTTCGTSLAAGSSCKLLVDFTPSIMGSRSGSLSVPGSFAASPATAALSGTGATPGTLAIVPSSHDFGQVVLNATSPPATFTATNSGGVAVTLQAPAITGDFSLQSTSCVGSLGADSSCTLQVSFSPAATGTRSGTLSMGGSFTGSPAAAALTGTGVAPGNVVFSPPSLNFGSVVVGGMSLATISASNTGGVAVGLGATSISGDYTILANACSGTLAPAASCSIEVSFSPSVTGKRPGTLSLSGTFISSPATAALAGMGVPPGNITFTPAGLSFGGVTENTVSAAATITATNTGGSTLTLEPPVVSSSYQITATTCTSSLAPRSACTVAITFAPLALGDTPGLLTIAGSMAGGQATAALDGMGVSPGAIVLSPAQLAFGSVAEGTSSSPLAMVLSNSGGTAVQLASLAVTGDYSVTARTCGSALAPGASCSVTIVFTPAAAGDRPGLLTVSGNFPGSPVSATLDGMGVTPGALVLAPASMSFGTVVIGSTSSAQTAILTNSGGAAISIPSPTISGDYVIFANTCGSTLAPSANCTFAVVFKPTAAGDRPGALAVAGAPASVSLDGNGILPALIEFSPASLSFGSITVGGVSAPETITATNNGGAQAELQTPTITGDYQITSNTCSSALAVEASCALQIAFAPSATGDRPGQLNLLVEAPGTGAAAILDGTGIPPNVLVLTPASLGFGSQAVGSVSPAGNITVANTGSVPIPLNTPAITGDFALSVNTCGATLPAQTSCTLSITFTPAASGVRTGVLSISSGSISKTALLSGTGIAPATDALAPPALIFSGQQVGTVSAAQAVTLTNSGNATLSGIAVTVTGPFTVTNNCGATLSGEATCGIAVAYIPTGTGVQSGVLTVADAIRTQSVSLSGTGTPPPSAFAAPSLLNFGGYALGGTSPAQSVAITNNGQTTLAGITVTITGSFALATNTCSATLPPGASCQLGVEFTPQQIGSATGQVVVASSALAEPLLINMGGAGEDFQLSVVGSSSSVLTSGQSAVYQLQATPVGASSGALALICSGAPALSTCTINPASLMVSGGATGTAFVTLATGITAANAQPDLPWRRFGALALLLPGLLLPRRSRRALALLLLGAAIALIPSACGVHASAGAGGPGTGPGSLGTGTPAGTYPITITGTFPGAARTVTVTLIVQ